MFSTIIFGLAFLLYVLASVVLILVVLVQSGKGGGLSGLVGSGTALGDHLGATGAEKTLNRWTSYCAVGFLVLNIFLVLMGPSVFKRSVIDTLGETAPAGQPSATATPQASTGAAPRAATGQGPQRAGAPPAGARAGAPAPVGPARPPVPAAGSPPPATAPTAPKSP